MLKKIVTFLLFLYIFLFLPLPTQAAVNLVRTPSNTAVYFVDASNVRHAFPNQKIYESWFGNDFKKISFVSEEALAKLPLGKNVVLKAGKYLVKIPSAPDVYAVEPGGTLRHIESAEAMETIYGKNWQQKLIDLSEVFFDDYVLGAPIKFGHQIPDGVVYKLINKNNYYYKTAGHLQKFASWQDVLANGYNQNDVVENITSFFLHGAEIEGYDENINNLAAENNLARYDCENKNLRAAFIFVYDGTYNLEEVEKMKAIKNRLPEYFNWTTDGLSQLTLDNDIFLIKKENYHIFESKLSLSQLAFDFYKQHSDVYDFLFIFDNFSEPSKIIAEYYAVTNQIAGIQKPILKAEVQYGSLGKLKGVIKMFSVNSHLFGSDSEQNITLNNIIHEMLHQWSGVFTFLNDKKEEDTSLYNEKLKHWSNYVNFVSPLGGYGWRDNGDGTFTQTYVNQKIKLSNLDLYGMGLLPQRGIGEIFYIVPENSLITDTISAKKVVVSADSLVKAMGKWQCLVK
ncbi:MAG: hypothetical protein PHT40_00940 [Patescibacteria group bacterium]|nr:hypothetical protein [Patescibacteria group bacterium]